MLAFLAWALFHHKSLNELVNASDGVMLGTPHWRVFQNRLLGPFIVTCFPGSPSQRYYGFVFISFLLTFMSYVSLLKIYAPTCSVWLWAIYAVLLFRFTLHHWSYPWDFTETLALLALVHMSLRQSPPWHFAALFLLWIVSRESALFLSMYIFFGWLFGMFSISVISFFCAISAIGIGYVVLTRLLLFKHSMLAGVGLDTGNGVHNHVHFLENLQRIQGALTGHHTDRVFLFLAFLAFFVWACSRSIRSIVAYGRSMAALNLTLLAYLLSTIWFGEIIEGRMYQPFVPCTLLIAAILLNNENRKPVIDSGVGRIEPIAPVALALVARGICVYEPS